MSRFVASWIWSFGKQSPGFSGAWISTKIVGPQQARSTCGSYNAGFIKSPLSWALEPECRILVFMLSLGPLDWGCWGILDYRVRCVFSPSLEFGPKAAPVEAHSIKAIAMSIRMRAMYDASDTVAVCRIWWHWAVVGSYSGSCRTAAKHVSALLGANIRVPYIRACFLASALMCGAYYGTI